MSAHFASFTANPHRLALVPSRDTGYREISAVRRKRNPLCDRPVGPWSK